MSLTIDHREKDLKTLFPDAEYKNMDLGDIHIKFKNSDHTFLLIERKTMSDLIASINDGRYREQKKRLLESGIPRERILYLLEGRVDDIPGHMKTLFGMIINTLFRDKLSVIRFETIEETIYFIKRLLEKVESNDPNIVGNQNHNLESNNNQISNVKKENEIENETEPNTNTTNTEYLSTIKLKKKDNLTTDNCSVLQLAQIPGMSVQNGQIVLNKYKSIANLINTYYQIDEIKRSQMLADLEISLSTGKTRKLGKVLSERIYQYLFNINI
jgi:crossover junction endonuclease MUS81